MKDRRALRRWLRHWPLLELTVAFILKMAPLTIVVVGAVIKRLVGTPIRIKVGLRLLTIPLIYRRIVTLHGANTVARIGGGRSVVSATLVKIAAPAEAECQQHDRATAHLRNLPTV